MTLRATIVQSANATDSDVKKKYTLVVQRLKRQLRENDVSEEERDEIKEVISLLKDGIHVVDVKPSSVQLLVWCSQLSSLERFHELLTDGTVKNIIETVFNRLLKTSPDNRLHVDVEWDENTYNELVSYFQSWTGMSHFGLRQ
jgi:predicted RNA binding protein with dsRBD fold (UPF0201 family)